MSKITQRQADTLTFIKTFIAENGFPPTLSEIADHFKIVINAANDRLKNLILSGAVERAPNQSRSIKVVKGFRVRIK